MNNREAAYRSKSSRPSRPWLALGCVAALAAAQSGCDEPEAQARWSIVFSELDAALLSVAGTSDEDVWIVGADAGAGPTILHFDGTDWNNLEAPTRGDLWWVSVHDDTVWMAGDGGTVLRLRRGASTPELLETPTDLRLFGVYAFADDDVWAVGGDPDAQSGVVLRFDGQMWSEVDLPDGAEGLTFFKIWGSAPEDVWIVGHGGKALHFDGDAFAVVPVPQGRPLLTVHGAADGDDVVAVGGFGSGLIVEAAQDGTLVDSTPRGALVPQLNGVHVGERFAVAAGVGGAVWQRDTIDTDGEWAPISEAPTIPRDYHAVYVDPSGGIWAVGGDIVAPPLRSGVLSYFGTREVED